MSDNADGGAGTGAKERPKKFKWAHQLKKMFVQVFHHTGKSEKDRWCNGTTRFNGASFTGANLKDAVFVRVDLSQVEELSQDQVDSACFKGSKLPSGLKAKENCRDIMARVARDLSE